MSFVLFITTVAGYSGYRHLQQNLRENSDLECEVDCSDSIPERLPGTLKGWVKYEDPNEKFSFEYPESWFYVVKEYHLLDDLIPVVPGLYSISKEELEEGLINPKVDMGIYRFDLDYTTVRPGRNLGGGGEIVSTKHTFFGKTDVTTTVECLREGIPYKGGVIGGDIQSCGSASYIDLGDKGFIRTSSVPKPDWLYDKDFKVYEKVLSTIKLSN